MTRALILTLGVCYHARLESRKKFEKKILLSFINPISVKKAAEKGGAIFRNEIKWYLIL